MKKKAEFLIIAISVLVPLLVFYLFYFKEGQTLQGSWLNNLPGFHAILNSLTALALICGRWAISKRKELLHRKFMFAAFGFSALFLISYVTYHSNAEPTRYGGEGALKLIYFFILITHILLAAIILPLVLFSIYFAISDQRAKHKRLVKWTLTILASPMPLEMTGSP